MAHEATSTLLIDASPETLFQIVSDVEAYPEWLSDVKSVTVLERTEEGHPASSAMRVDVTIREVEYTLDYEYEYPVRMAWKNRPGGDVKEIVGSYVFEEQENGGTLVHYELGIDPGFRVPGFMLKQAAKHITRHALNGLAERAAATR